MLDKIKVKGNIGVDGATAAFCIGDEAGNAKLNQSTAFTFNRTD